jgi:hypothetical protein
VPKRTVDRIILGAMLVVIAVGLYGGWRLYEWSEGPDPAAEVQAWFDARGDEVIVDSCAYQELDSVVDFHNCVIRTDDAEVLSRYGATDPDAEIRVCFSVPRAAVLGYRSDHDPLPENQSGSSGDCLGRT